MPGSLLVSGSGSLLVSGEVPVALTAGASPELAHLHEESSRGHRRDGFLHRTDGELSLALRALRDPARQARHRPLEHHRNPLARWVIQQLREAFPYGSASRYLVFDRDAIFSPEVARAVRSPNLEPTRTSYRSPWQFGEYMAYYLEDRTHLGLGKDAPLARPGRAMPSRIGERPGPIAGWRAAPPVLVAHRCVEAQERPTPDCRTPATSRRSRLLSCASAPASIPTLLHATCRAHHVRSGFGERQAGLARLAAPPLPRAVSDGR